MNIRPETEFGASVVTLLRHHLDSMQSQSPPESVHALDLDELKSPDIAFWTCWDADTLMGCAALKRLDAAHGEIKSMRTAHAYIRRGVAASLLQHLLNHAITLRYQRLSLETGSNDEFAAARQLYSQFGFRYCKPFSDYQPDPHSVFMTLDLAQATWLGSDN